MNGWKGNLVLVLCAIYSLIGALYPFEFSGKTLNVDHEPPWKLLTALAVPLRNVSLDDFLENIVYFLPWGALVYVLGSSCSRKLFSVLSAVLVGSIVSFSIELCQIFFSKNPSIFDVLANTIGSGLGALLCAFSPMDVRRVAERSLARAERSRLLLAAALFLGAVPVLISISRFSGSGLKLWNRHYTFQLGKAASLEDPWLGEVYLVAVYDRALAPEVIAQNYKMSRSNDVLEPPANTSLVVLCRFTERQGHESRKDSYCRLPLNFALILTSNFRWVQGRNGIDILKPSVLRQEARADKLFNAIRGRKELSMEVWLATSRVEQKERFRVVSPALNRLASDFTPRPERVRRALAAQAVNLGSKNEFRAPEQFHLVVTYKGGFRELFVNGRKHPYKNFDLRLADFMVSFGNNPVAQIAYSFVFFFPISFLFSRAVSKRSLGYSLSLLAPVTIAVSLLGMAEVLQAYLFARPVDLIFVSYGIVVVVVGALCGIFLANETPSLRQDSLLLS